MIRQRAVTRAKNLSGISSKTAYMCVSIYMHGELLKPQASLYKYCILYVDYSFTNVY